MKKKSLLLAVLIFTNSCGTLFSGKNQTLNLLPSDSLAESEVEVTSGKVVQVVRLPSMIVAQRSNSNLIINVKENDCYKSSQTIRESRLNMFSILNILGSWFSTSSTTTDSMTGALWSYDDTIMVNLQKKSDCKK